MSGAPVIVRRAGDVFHLRLNRPGQANACSDELVRALDAALRQAESQQATAVVLRGEGRHFCAGFDLSGLEQETDDSLLARFVRIELLLQRIARAPFLTIALAQGRAMGAGADLFAACRLRLVHGEASFAFPGARGFGLVLGTRRLAALVGADMALGWVQSARVISTDEACRAGLATAVIGDAQELETHLAARCVGDEDLHASLQRAVAPQAAIDDACDLAALVRSAARPGLRERIAKYLQAVAASRRGTS